LKGGPFKGKKYSGEDRQRKAEGGVVGEKEPQTVPGGGKLRRRGVANSPSSK